MNRPLTLRIAIVLLLAINVILYSADSGLWGAPLTAGLHNPAPLTSQLNPTAMQVRPLAPGEGDGHPVVGPPVPDIKVMQTDLSGSTTGAPPDGVASAASSASAPVASPAQGGSSVPGGQAAAGGASAALVASAALGASASLRASAPLEASAARGASSSRVASAVQAVQAAPATVAPTTKATGSAQPTPATAPKS